MSQDSNHEIYQKKIDELTTQVDNQKMIIEGSKTSRVELAKLIQQNAELNSKIAGLESKLKLATTASLSSPILNNTFSDFGPRIQESKLTRIDKRMLLRQEETTAQLMRYNPFKESDDSYLITPFLAELAGLKTQHVYGIITGVFVKPDTKNGTHVDTGNNPINGATSSYGYNSGYNNGDLKFDCRGFIIGPTVKFVPKSKDLFYSWCMLMDSYCPLELRFNSMVECQKLCCNKFPRLFPSSNNVNNSLDYNPLSIMDVYVLGYDDEFADKSRTLAKYEPDGLDVGCFLTYITRLGTHIIHGKSIRSLPCENCEDKFTKEELTRFKETFKTLL